MGNQYGSRLSATFSKLEMNHVNIERNTLKKTESEERRRKKLIKCQSKVVFFIMLCEGWPQWSTWSAVRGIFSCHHLFLQSLHASVRRGGLPRETWRSRGLRSADESWIRRLPHRDGHSRSFNKQSIIIWAAWSPDTSRDLASEIAVNFFMSSFSFALGVKSDDIENETESRAVYNFFKESYRHL